ncbi:MAG: DUF362 domain-containing protein [Candidatus Cloacimonadaceae bacterium]
MKTKVAVRNIESYQLAIIKEAVADFLSSANPSRLQNAKTVLIKPNLLGAFAPEQAVTTHPVVIEAIIQYLLEAGKEVWLGDSAGGTANTTDVWQVTGMQELADKYAVRLVNFSSFGIQDFTVDGVELKLSKVVWQADAIINVSKYKTHGLMAYTGAIKNLYGLVPGLIKTEYHKQYPDGVSFGHMLATLYMIVRHRVAYHIMDGIVGMDGAGPSAGTPKEFGLLFGSTSAAALDYLAASFMGFHLKQIRYVKEALHEEGIIPSQIEFPLSFNDFRLPNVNRKAVWLSSNLMLQVPNGVRTILKKVFDFYPRITEACQACQICVKSCPVQTIEVVGEGIPFIKTDKCIRCLCCHELCPYRAIEIHKSLVAKLFMH